MLGFEMAIGGEIISASIKENRSIHIFITITDKAYLKFSGFVGKDDKNYTWCDRVLSLGDSISISVKDDIEDSSESVESTFCKEDEKKWFADTFLKLKELVMSKGLIPKEEMVFPDSFNSKPYGFELMIDGKIIKAALEYTGVNSIIISGLSRDNTAVISFGGFHNMEHITWYRGQLELGDNFQINISEIEENSPVITTQKETDASLLDCYNKRKDKI